jgi:hypothetical protein
MLAGPPVKLKAPFVHTGVTALAVATNELITTVGVLAEEVQPAATFTVNE